ncbi:MAG: efflux RND transporter periplasmic adaptor subunit [Congregibacter sp.]|nr:efflux RND transporter periplasmic adaptor subunit [Congregibacter sp.]
MLSKPWLFGFLSVLMLTACEDPGATADMPSTVSSAVPVDTEVVKLAQVARDAESVGTLVGNESVTITAKLTEQVSAVHFEGGELVKAGAVLVELIDAEQIALLHEAEAKLRETQLQLDRLLTLGKDIATAAEIDVARSRVDANVALLEALRSRINDRTIRAPFDGVIGLRRISVGALLTPGTVIAELDDVDPMKLDFTLPEHYLSQITIGDSVRAISTAWDGEAFSGQVTQIGSRVDPATRAFSVRALIDNGSARLRPGMLMAVEVALGKTPGILVSETALIQAGAKSTVFVVDEDSTARRVGVEIGRRMPGLIEIRSGLTPGDRIVLNGQMTLRPGVRVREAGSAPLPDVSAIGME